MVRGRSGRIKACLLVQWLRLSIATAGGTGSRSCIPRGTAKKKKKEVRGSDTAVFPEKATAAAFHPLFGEHVLGVGRQYQDIQLCKGI